MAQPYLDDLATRLRVWKPATPRGVKVECRHFFTGAALYANDKIAASLTPKGLALKLPEAERLILFRERRARRLRYFAGGPIKKDYALLSRSVASDPVMVGKLLARCIRYVCSG